MDRQVSIYFSVVFLRQVREIPIEEMAGGFSITISSVYHLFLVYHS